MKKLLLILLLMLIITSAYSETIPAYTIKDIEGEWVGIVHILDAYYCSLRVDKSGKGQFLSFRSIERSPNILNLSIISIDKNKFTFSLDSPTKIKHIEVNIIDPNSLNLIFPIIDNNKLDYIPIFLIKKGYLDKLMNHEQTQQSQKTAPLI